MRIEWQIGCRLFSIFRYLLLLRYSNRPNTKAFVTHWLSWLWNVSSMAIVGNVESLLLLMNTMRYADPKLWESNHGWFVACSWWWLSYIYDFDDHCFSLIVLVKHMSAVKTTYSVFSFVGLLFLVLLYYLDVCIFSIQLALLHLIWFFSVSVIVKFDSRTRQLLLVITYKDCLIMSPILTPVSGKSCSTFT